MVLAGNQNLLALCDQLCGNLCDNFGLSGSGWTTYQEQSVRGYCSADGLFLPVVESGAEEFVYRQLLDTFLCRFVEERGSEEGIQDVSFFEEIQCLIVTADDRTVSAVVHVEVHLPVGHLFLDVL